MEIQTFKLKSGRNFTIRAFKKYPFDLITLYICDHNIVYHSPSVLSMDIMGKLKFGSTTMETQMRGYLPMDFSRFEDEDGSHFLVIKKDPNLFILRDILTHMGQKMPPRHVAWVISTLYNLCCYLEYAKISHESINIDTFYINPVTHSGALLGSWWTAHEEEDEKSSPEPFDRFKAALLKHSESSTYSNTVKRIGKELLGDAEDTPMALLEFLSAPSDETKKDYAMWPIILQRSFGPRRFTEMKISRNDLYPDGT